MEINGSLSDYSEHPITKQILFDLLKDYKRPFDKINELVKQGQLLHVKRGIYIPGPRLKVAPPELFLLANHISGPSYISLDSALSYWGLIPERVYEISSVTTDLSKTYSTATGRFSYIHVALPYYSFGIKQVQLTKKQTVMMASPEKALCDKIVTTSGILLRSVKQTRDLLIGDFRIEKQMLRDLDVNTICEWLNKAPKKNSLEILVKTLKSL